MFENICFGILIIMLLILVGAFTACAVVMMTCGIITMIRELKSDKEEEYE